MRCTTCRTKTDQPICTGCQHRTATHINELPDHYQRVSLAIVAPPTTGLGEYTSGQSFESKPTAHMAALALTAVSATTIVNALVKPTPPPVKPPGPIPLWIISWAAVWRQRFEHHQPPVVPINHTPLQRPATDWRTTLGIQFANTPQPSDPVGVSWTSRFGTTDVSRRVQVDCRYLSHWLPTAWVAFDDMDLMVRGLDALTAAVRSVMGDRVVYLGKCPEIGDDDVLCGGALTRGRDTTDVVCPRCHTRIPESGLLMLARRMRDAWGGSADRDAWR